MSSSESESSSSSSSGSSSDSSSSTASGSRSSASEPIKPPAKKKQRSSSTKTKENISNSNDNSNDNDNNSSKAPASPPPTTTTGPSSAPPLEIAPSVVPRTGEQQELQKIIVILDQAKLETVKTRRGNFELLNCDDHRDMCRKWKKNPAEYRPDICHQELLALIDSPLNKAGRLKVYLKTTKNVLIDVHPSLRVPRTYKRFAGLMVQLLHKMKIKAGNGSATLLRVIKNPVSQHLPPGTAVYGMTSAGTLYSPAALARTLLWSASSDQPQQTTTPPPVCFVIGAMASGSISLEDYPYIEKMISVSEYPLSGAAALSRILMGIEQHWGIV